MNERFSTQSVDSIVGSPKELAIVATPKCDLDCSFCGGDFHMSLDTAPLAVRKARAFEVFEKFDIPRVSWTGGEPMLAFRQMSELLAEIKEHFPAVKHELYTNGLSLKKEHLPFLKEFDAVFISFDGFVESERPLESVIKDGNFDFFEILDALDNVHIQTVLTRGRVANMRWHEDILVLYKSLFQYRPVSFRLIFDKKMPKPLSQDHVMNFIYGLDKIERQVEYCRFVNKDGPSVTVSKFFDSHCEGCSDVVFLQSDGTFNQAKVPDNINPKGCTVMANAIGIEAYKYISSYLRAGKENGQK